MKIFGFSLSIFIILFLVLLTRDFQKKNQRILTPKVKNSICKGISPNLYENNLNKNSEYEKLKNIFIKFDLDKPVEHFLKERNIYDLIMRYLPIYGSILILALISIFLMIMFCICKSNNCPPRFFF